MRGDYYNLSVTDLRFRRYCDKSKKNGMSEGEIGKVLQEILNTRDVFFRIGTSRPFSPKGDNKLYCFLLITGIYSFPDYEIGRVIVL
jgi:hypothetical protein